MAGTKLDQLESEIEAKRKGWSSKSNAADKPGAYHEETASGVSAALSSLEGNIIAKNIAAPKQGGNGLKELESDLAARNRACPNSGNGPGAEYQEQALSTFESDIIAKNRARPPVCVEEAPEEQAPTLSSFERDILAKRNAMPSPQEHTQGPNSLTTLETDVMAKLNVVSHRTATQQDMTGHTGLRNLEVDIASKSRVLPSSLTAATDEATRLSSSHSDSPNGSPLFSARPNFFGNPPKNYDDDEQTGYGDKADTGKESYPGLVGDVEYGNMQGALVTATPIKEEDDDTFIPAAVEYDPDAKPPLYKNRRCRVYGFVGLSFLVAIVVVSVIVTQLSETSSQLTIATMAPTSFRETLGIKEQITEKLGNEHFDDPETARFKALNWLTNQDSMQLEPDAENLIQRFIMALFYFQTSQGEPWLSCNPAGKDDTEFCMHQELIDSTGQGYQSKRWIRWLSTRDECEWAGVYCLGGKVTRIDLDGYRLSGTIPPELAKLDYLRAISLSWNNLTGPIPQDFAELKHLTHATLHDNLISGTIPKDWLEGSTIVFLDLARNKLSGTIPSEIHFLTDAKGLFLQGNELTGTLSKELCSLTNLEWLDLSRSQLSGTIPTEIGLLSRLENLILEDVAVTGTLPSEVGSLVDLYWLKLGNVALTGTIPEELYKLSRLGMFDITNSQISGTISTEIGRLTALKELFVSDSDLQGVIPSEIGLATSLSEVVINANDFSGSVPAELCALRVETGLNLLKADCSPVSSGEVPITCSASCCTHCCDAETAICYDSPQ